MHIYTSSFTPARHNAYIDPHNTSKVPRNQTMHHII